MSIFERFFHFFGCTFSVGNTIIIALFIIGIFTISSIIFIIRKMLSSINILNEDIKKIDSENILIIGRYITIVISALLLVLVILLIGLILTVLLN